MITGDITGNELDISQAKAVRKQQVGYHSKPVRKTAREFQVRNHLKRRLNWYSALEALGMTVCVGFLGYVFLKQPISKGIEELKFRQACTQAVEQYGDANGDGFVNAEENKELFQNIFYKTGITFNQEGATYSDGTYVPKSQLTKIVRDYIEHPFLLRE